MIVAGLEDWGEDAVLSQVLAASQQEYLDSLKERGGESEPGAGAGAGGEAGGLDS